jgi:hypothetical protein
LKEDKEGTENMEKEEVNEIIIKEITAVVPHESYLPFFVLPFFSTFSVLSDSSVFSVSSPL